MLKKKAAEKANANKKGNKLSAVEAAANAVKERGKQKPKNKIVDLWSQTTHDIV